LAFIKLAVDTDTVFLLPALMNEATRSGGSSRWLLLSFARFHPEDSLILCTSTKSLLAFIKLAVDTLTVFLLPA
jgi:hypothetical protein